MTRNTPKARLFAALAVLALLFAGAGDANAAPKKEFVAGEVLVKFKSGYDGPGAKAIEELGGRLLEKLSRIDVSRVKLPGGMTVEQALARLSKLPFVEYAEPNLILKPTAWAPSDPRWDEQWGMRTIRVPAGWSLSTGSKDVIVAIIDTGVDRSHPDLKQRLVPGYDFVDNDDRPDDVGGHGTHCAGIAAASANNGIGVAGVCPNCSVMPIRVMRPDGGSASDVAKGIVWAADRGAKVISLSLGGYFASSAQEDALEYAASKGALAVAAAGNQGIDSPHYPAYHDICLAVGSTEQNDSRSDFSNRGSWVDVAAPGSFIMSTVPGGGFEYKSGTSMSTPFVAGLAGLLFSRPGATAAGVRRAIEESSVPVGNWVARGRVDVRRALEALDAAIGSGSSKPPATEQKPPTTEQKPPSGGGGSAKAPEGGLAPSSHAVVQGKALKSPANGMDKSDDTLLVLRSTESGKKRYLTVEVTAKRPVAGAVSALKVEIEGRFYDNPNALKARIYNWKKNDWQWLGQGNLNLSDTVLWLTASGPAECVSSAGEIKVRLERASDWYASFDLGLDVVRFHVTTGGAKAPDPAAPSPSPAPPPPDKGGDSLVDKAVDKWNKWNKP
ncbi:MAG TPA: S8 family peptidase [Phycisphaerae bacterium]|nr:S8 family peptidase [Phycisphaerae bacterium]